MLHSDIIILMLQYISAFYCCSRAAQFCIQYAQKIALARSMRVKQSEVFEAIHHYAIVEVSGPWEMEDRTLVAPLGIPSQDTTLYAVFDGHHGHSAAQYLVDNLAFTVQAELATNSTAPQALTDAFKRIDKAYIAIPHHESGSTCCALVVDKNKLTVANTGDSRCILVSDLGRVTELSRDHKPDRADERARIVTAGGSISHWGVWRLEGILAMSRVIGDRTLKRYAIPDPEIIEHVIRPTDRYVVLATDGVWDVLRNEQVGRICAQSHTADQCAIRIMRDVVKHGLVDNSTVLVVDLNQ